MASRRTATSPDHPTTVFWNGGVPVGRSPAALARRFAQVCAGVLAETLAGEDLVPLQWAVLAYLNDEPDIDQAGLAARLAVDRSNAGLLVDQLEARGLAVRRVNGVDRRARLLRLTPRGSKLFERLRGRAGPLSGRVLASLTPAEGKLFIDLLIRIIKANESYARPGNGRRKPGSNPSPDKTSRT
jgi:DNA-binding MarR family transcriptional regulator